MFPGAHHPRPALLGERGNELRHRGAAQAGGGKGLNVQRSLFAAAVSCSHTSGTAAWKRRLLVAPRAAGRAHLTQRSALLGRAVLSGAQHAQRHCSAQHRAACVSQDQLRASLPLPANASETCRCRQTDTATWHGGQPLPAARALLTGAAARVPQLRKEVLQLVQGQPSLHLQLDRGAGEQQEGVV